MDGDSTATKAGLTDWARRSTVSEQSLVGLYTIHRANVGGGFVHMDQKLIRCYFCARRQVGRSTMDNAMDRVIDTSSWIFGGKGASDLHRRESGSDPPKPLRSIHAFSVDLAASGQCRSCRNGLLYCLASPNIH
ncbi:hypothetical protein SEVIR_7G103001v4 [Setaria viridis]